MSLGRARNDRVTLNLISKKHEFVECVMWHGTGIRSSTSGQSSHSSSQFLLTELSTFFFKLKHHISLPRRNELIILVIAKNALGQPLNTGTLCPSKSRLRLSRRKRKCPMLSDRTETNPQLLNGCAHTTSDSNTDTDPINSGRGEGHCFQPTDGSRK